MITGSDTYHECGFGAGEDNCQACENNRRERAERRASVRTLEPGYYHPTERFRQMYEHISVMDTSKADWRGDGELVALFGPSRAGGATEEEMAQSQADARLFIAAGCFLKACGGPENEVSRLDWLAALLSTVQESEAWGVISEPDPDAMMTCLVECQRLLEGLRAAAAKATGKGTL